jgi:hypothetical protein
MNWERNLLVLAAAAIIGLSGIIGSNMVNAHGGGHGHYGGRDYDGESYAGYTSGANAIHPDVNGGVYHTQGNKIRHCDKDKDAEGGLSCTAWK